MGDKILPAGISNLLDNGYYALFYIRNINNIDRYCIYKGRGKTIKNLIANDPERYKGGW